ncbi:MAG: SCO family protein [Gemmatirosa sp.]
MRPTLSRCARLAAGTLMLAFASACGLNHDWHGSPVEPPAPAPALALAAGGGRSFDLAQERGNVVLVFFGYTRCPDACPTTLADWSKAKRLLGADSARVRWVFVSVDPERDPPDSAAAYARRFDPAFVGLGGTPAQLEAVRAAWGVAAVPETPQADPHAAHPAQGSGQAAPMTMVSHTPRTFVIDPEGRLRLLFDPASRPEGIAGDVKALL